MHHVVRKHHQIERPRLRSSHRCCLFPLQNFAIKASRVSGWEVKVVRWPYSRTPTFFIWSFWVNLFWVKCILCCSAHERHAFYVWNLWEIVQTQHVTQGALLAAFWREALQMRGKEGATAGRRPRGWSSVRPCGAAASGGSEVRGVRPRGHRACRQVLWASCHLTAR